MSSAENWVHRDEFERLLKQVTTLAATVESLEETLEILQDTELMGSLRRAEQDLKEGRVHGAV